jgi:single-stranded-DNA-specific exonuclease
MSKYLKNLAKVAQRVKTAAKKSEPVIIFGDSDLDGIASVVILKELLEYLNPLYGGEQVNVYFADREIEGYGLTHSCLDYIKQFAPALLFVLDSGISNFEEIKRAKKLGFEVIIIDHHKIIDKLPQASLIIDPKQKKDTYPFKEMAAAGLVYKLAEFILSKNKQPAFIRDKFLELAALATISDMMPQEEDNKEIIDNGLRVLLETQRPAFLALAQIGDVDLGSELDISEKIIAPLNSFTIKNHISESYSLLVEDSFSKAKKLAQKLVRQRNYKKQAIKLFFNELKQEVEKETSNCIVKHSKAWPAAYLGTISSKVLKISNKPVFICKEAVNQECICSGRLPKGLDGVQAMAHCKKYLITYGGHPPACGCRLKLKDFDKFSSCLENYFKKNG